MSAPVAPIVAVATLFAALLSLVAPVVAVTVLEPVVDGVPVTVQVILAPGATDTGGVGAHANVRPAGRPEIEQVATVAETSGAAPFEHVNDPL